MRDVALKRVGMVATLTVLLLPCATRAGEIRVRVDGQRAGQATFAVDCRSADFSVLLGGLLSAAGADGSARVPAVRMLLRDCRSTLHPSPQVVTSSNLMAIFRAHGVSQATAVASTEVPGLAQMPISVAFTNKTLPEVLDQFCYPDLYNWMYVNAAIVVAPAEFDNGRRGLERRVYFVREMDLRARLSRLPEHLAPFGESVAFDRKDATLTVIAPGRGFSSFHSILDALGIDEIREPHPPDFD